MSYISEVRIDGATYSIKDGEARDALVINNTVPFGSLNAFDYAAERLEGKYASVFNSGQIGTEPSYVCYHYIPVVPGQVFWLTSFVSNAHIVFHGPLGEYLSSYATPGDAVTVPSAGVIGQGKITIPNGCRYLSVSYGEMTMLMNFGWPAALYPFDYFLNGDETYYLPKDGRKNYGREALISNRNLLPFIHGGFKDHYYAYDSGYIMTATGYVAMEIPALPSTAYSYPIGDGHFSFFTENGQYISGVANQNSFTTPANCAFMRIGFPYDASDDTAGNVVLVAGQEKEGIYSPFGSGDIYAREPQTITVGPNQEYAAIGEAIAAAKDDDVILVYPGVYRETLNAYAKRVHIQGVSREHCVLEYSADDYYKPPLYMAKGSVKNMTIHAFWSGNTAVMRAYCVHIDDINERGETLLFDNVHFINERGACVGIGLRTDCHLKFSNCIFHTTASGGEGPIYNHTSEYETEGWGGYNVYENQNVDYINCVIINETAEASIYLQSQERRDKCCKITFIGNKVIQPHNNGKTISMVMWEGRTLTNTNFMGSSDFVLTDISALNSDAPLDAAQAALNTALSTVQDTVNTALQEAKDSGVFDGPPGEKGAQGAVGPAGPAGKDGISPTITVTDIAGGHQVTIIDADGPHTFDVLNGEAEGGRIAALETQLNALIDRVQVLEQQEKPNTPKEAAFGASTYGGAAFA